MREHRLRFPLCMLVHYKVRARLRAFESSSYTVMTFVPAPILRLGPRLPPEQAAKVLRTSPAASNLPRVVVLRETVKTKPKPRFGPHFKGRVGRVAPFLRGFRWGQGLRTDDPGKPSRIEGFERGGLRTDDPGKPSRIERFRG